MKFRVYLRVAKTSKTSKGKQYFRTSSHSRPNYSALFKEGYQSKQYYPTVLIALDLDIPDKAFQATEVALKLTEGQIEPAIEASGVDVDVV